MFKLSAGRTENYDEMLTRIFFGTLLISCLACWWLRTQVPGIEAILAHGDVLSQIEALKDLRGIPGGSLLVGLAVAVLFRILKMHDRISDVLAIRRTFDIHMILTPLIGELGKPVGIEKRAYLHKHRSRLMGMLFYAYASSEKDRTKIDANVIKQALDWWTWTWICVEGALVAFLASAAAALFSGYATAWGLLTCGVGLCIIAYLLIRHACSRTATAEVREIVSDQTRWKEMKGKLDALQDF